MTQAVTPLGTTLFKRLSVRARFLYLFVPVLAFSFALMAVILALLYLYAEDRHRQSAEFSEHLARSAIAVMAEQMKRTVRDYAWWNDAAKKLGSEFDAAWADENIGSWPHGNLDVDIALVLNTSLEPIYVAVNGLSGGAAAALVSRFMPIAEPALENAGADGSEPSTSHGFLRIGNVVHIAAASAIKFERDGSADGGNPVGVLVFARALNQSTMGEIARLYLLDGLDVALPGAKIAGPSLRLISPEGELVGILHWRTEGAPSDALFYWVLPLASTGVPVLILLAWSAARMRRATTLPTATGGAKANDAGKKPSVPESGL